MRRGKPLSDAERAERRAADREYVRQAVEALRSSDGWQQWLTTRARFHAYSTTNQLLLAMQRPSATYVAGFKRWLSLGYFVHKGETALRVWAPIPPSKKKLEAWRANGAVPEDRPRTFFKLSPVFADDQVAELPPPAEPAPLHCPIRELAGDDLAPILPALIALGAEIGSEVRFEAIPGGARGYYALDSHRIGIEAEMAVNQQAVTLVHELAHALVRADRHDTDPELGYASEELVVESVAFTVARGLVVDSDAKSIPYLASWSETAELSVIEQTAGLIDRLARRIETAIDAQLQPAAQDTDMPAAAAI